MSALLHKAAKAISEAAANHGFTWLVTARPELSRGPKDQDTAAEPASNELPAVIVQTGGYRALQPGDATAYVVVTVNLHQQADDTDQELAVLRSEEFGAWIKGSTFRTDINALDGFHAIGIGTIAESFDVVGRRWQTGFTFEILAIPSNL